MMPYMEFIIAYMEEFLDISNFEQPIQYTIKTLFFNPATDMKLVFYQVAFNHAVLQDSWLTSSYGAQNRTYTTFNFDFYDTMLKTSGTQL